jgi:dTDP-4-amino-4,6-dideoxygalactose transaminase
MSKLIYFENLSKSNLFFRKKLKDKFNFFLKKGNFILSDNVTLFEKNFAKFIGAKSCVGVGNGLDALTIAFRALEIKKNSEVIVAANSYIACIMAIKNSNLRPILVEPDIKTYNLDIKKIEKKITKKTKAILAVHLYGKPCDMKPLKKICKKYKLFLIEDCAQSHGASINGQITGSFGDMGCFSFYPTKNLGGFGDGGAITCNNQSLYNKLKKIRNYGSVKKYQNDILGVNSRLDEIQAAFLSIKLKYLNKINNHKIKLAALYDKFLKNDFIKPIKQKNIKDVFHIYNIRHIKRDKIKKYLENHNIQTDIHYKTPPHRQKCFKNDFKEQYPITDKIHATTLSLPISYSHKKKDILQIIKVLNNF